MTRYQISTTLETARKERGMTYKALAYHVGLTPDTVRGILQGLREPTLDSLIRICHGLGLAVSVAERLPFEMG